ncbi:MAG: serine hydrolase [Paludibacter sp.]|nr:serine hydrolase [Paludibacter sp.]
MKTHTFFIWLITFSAVLTACTDQEPEMIRHAEYQKKIQQLVDSTLHAYQTDVPDFPGGVALKIIYKGNAFFVSSGMGDHITGNIHFRAASITKTFTATAILLLHQQGKLNVNDYITDMIPGTTKPYLPASPTYEIPHKDSITILNLLRHRAGVFDIVNDNIPDTISASVPYKGLNYIDYITETAPAHTFTFDELAQVLSETGISYFTPGSAHHYSNTGYSMLGKIIESVSNKTYQQFLMEEVVIPMGLTNSSFPSLGSDQEMSVPYATGTVIYNNESFDLSSQNVTATVAEGNLISTPDDLSLFINKLFTGQGVLNYYTVYSQMMHYLPTDDSVADGYGCGLRYMNMLGYGHTGAIAGYLSIMVCDPQLDFTAVAFTNAWNFNQGVPGLERQLNELIKNICYKSKALMKNY